MRVCLDCGETKDESLFHFDKRSTGARRPMCKVCNKDRRLERQYGLPRGMYRKMYDALNGICPLCDRFFPILDVDHDHATGEVRGLLCRSCNRRLGFIEDADWLTRALTYLGR